MRTEATWHLPTGLYVLKSEKVLVLEDIEKLGRAFNRVLCDKQAVAECKACRSKMLLLLEEHFVDTRVKKKCIKRMEDAITDDVNRARAFGKNMLSILTELSIVVTNSVPFKDMPSCRSLLAFSCKEAAEKALDLVGNGIVKVSSTILSIGSEVYHIVQIADVKRYYSDLLSCIQKSAVDGSVPSTIELLTENKSKEELEYCRLALLKVSGKLTKDTIDLSKQVIDKLKQKNEDVLIGA